MENDLFTRQHKTLEHTGFGGLTHGYEDNTLSLDEHLIKHPAATYFVVSKGEALVDERINKEDVLVVDRAIEPQDKSIVVASVGGELVLRRLVKKAGQTYLISVRKENRKFIRITGEEDSYIEGVVTYVIHKV